MDLSASQDIAKATVYFAEANHLSMGFLVVARDYKKYVSNYAMVSVGSTSVKTASSPVIFVLGWPN